MIKNLQGFNLLKIQMFQNTVYFILNALQTINSGSQLDGGCYPWRPHLMNLLMTFSYRRKNSIPFTLNIRTIGMELCFKSSLAQYLLTDCNIFRY